MIRQPQRLPDPQIDWFDPSTGRPTVAFYGYMREFDAAMRSMVDALNAGRVAPSFAHDDLPAAIEGAIVYVDDGRKAGEGAGSGTGVLAFGDASNWIAVDTGTAVAD